MKKSQLFKFFASLKLAVFSILLLAAVLAVATFLEALYGTRAVHVLVYGTWWFGGVLILLALNVLCAALSRYPWKRNQTGFVITHAGILVLIFGSFMTQQWGVDANLPVVEGGQENDAILNELTLALFDEKTGSTREFAVPETANLKTGNLMRINLNEDSALVVDQFVPRALPNKQMIPSSISNIGSPAIHLEVFNERFRIDEWISVQNPEVPADLNLGPATISFKKLWSAEEEKKFLNEKAKAPENKPTPGYLVLQYKGREYRADIGEFKSHWAPVANSGLELQVLKYLPYAVVENNELVSKSEDPVNPAVQLELRPKGTEDTDSVEKHTIFANFPEFSTLHGGSKRKKVPLGAKFRMISSQKGNKELAFVGKKRGELRLAQSADNTKLLFRVLGADGEENAKGEVKIGQEQATGWMDLKFQVTEWLQSAVEDTTPKMIEYISGQGDNYLTALHFSIVSKRAVASAGSETGGWLLEGQGKTFSFGSQELFIHYTKKKLTIPFFIHLEKFTIGTDPGTTKAASYKSNVLLKDQVNGVEQKAEISMNEPMVYGGYTFYQASYQMEEGRPPISIFAVNRDPGRSVKYMGSLIMCLGILLMFYMNPHYWDILLGRRKEQESK